MALHNLVMTLKAKSSEGTYKWINEQAATIARTLAPLVSDQNVEG